MADLRALRTFTADTEPPHGERITLMTQNGDRLIWTGKRWFWATTADHLCNHEAWPRPPTAPSTR